MFYDWQIVQRKININMGIHFICVKCLMHNLFFLITEKTLVRNLFKILLSPFIYKEKVKHNILKLQLLENNNVFIMKIL